MPRWSVIMTLKLTNTPVAGIRVIPDVDVLMIDKGHKVKVNESSLNVPPSAEQMAAAWGVEQKTPTPSSMGRVSAGSRQCLTERKVDMG
jgi:hypothetical protein